MHSREKKKSKQTPPTIVQGKCTNNCSKSKIFGLGVAIVNMIASVTQGNDFAL